jgi:Flp pilus assembly protein TadD
VIDSTRIKNLLDLYQKRQYDEAEKVALLMTLEFPDHQFPWKLLGVIFGQTGRKSEAMNASQKAVKLVPHDPQAHNNLGNSFQELGRFNEAEASYKKAISLKVDFTEAHNNLGNIFQKLQRFDEAEASYRQAILLEANFAGAHNNLGIVLKKLGRFDEAEASYRQAILLKTDDAGAHNNLGNILKDKGDLLAAIESYKQAINIHPNFAEAWNNIFFPLQSLKLKVFSIKDHLPLLEEQKIYKYAQTAKSILSYRLNLGSSSANHSLNEVLNILSSTKNTFIKNPENIPNKFIKEHTLPKKITALVHFGRSGTGLLHSLLDGHSEVTTLPSIYFSELFDHLTWKKITAGGWEEMANRFSTIYAVLFDASSATQIASRGMQYIDNIGKKEGMTNVGTEKNEIVSVDKKVFIKELNYLIESYDRLDAFTFFKLVHFAYEKTLNNHNEKKLLFYHIHNPDTYAQLNFLRLAPHVSWIMMVREPIQSCESWIKKDFLENNHKKIVNKIFKMLFELDQVIFEDKNSIGLKLEDLKEHPKKTIPALCNWLGIKQDDSLYQMTVQGKKWWGDPSSPDYEKDGMDPFGKTSINRKLGSIFSENDQFILRTLFYPFSVRFGYVKENLEQFKKDILTIKPMLDQMFDFEKKIAQNTKVDTEKFMKSGPYLYLRSGMIERWNTLNNFHTYPNMLSPLNID